MAVHTAFTGDELGSFSWYSYEKYKDQNMSRAKAFSVIILMVGCLEFLLCCGSIGYVAHAYKRDQKRVRTAHIPNGKNGRHFNILLPTFKLAPLVLNTVKYYFDF